MQHEILVELFRNRPSMAAELLAEVFDVKIPFYEEAAITSENVTDIKPAEYRADLVVKLLRNGKVVFVIVVEVQLSIDPDKRFTWPPYVTVTREEYRCPVDLLILAPDPVVAKWCEEPIPIGVRRFVLEPPVLQGNRIPKVKDPAEATRRPELALLSAMAHGDSDEAIDIGRAALEGFSALDPELAGFYSDILYNAINEAARRALEVKMKGYVFTSPYAAEIFQQGRDEGVKQGRDEGVKLAARSLINMLRARSIDVPEQTRQRIFAEQDIQRIERWLERAVAAETLNEVFVEPN
jgi:hypothetical protein